MKCGIDFGTSNTTMALHDGQQARLIPLEDGKPTIPTALFFPEDITAPILFGRAAQRAYLEGQEGRLLRSLKRLLGTSLMEQTTLLRGRRWAFPEIIAQFLTHVKQQGENYCGTKLIDITIGRPVHFQDNDTQADTKAQQQLTDIARDIGFTQIAFQFEPVAAALAHEQYMPHAQLGLVIDIGGGTSDFSVIRLCRDHQQAQRDRQQDVLANCGIRVGGNDCDRAIHLAAIMPLLGLGGTYGDKELDIPARLYFELSEWAKINWCYTPQNIQLAMDLHREAHAPEQLQRLIDTLEYRLGHRLLDVSETIKIILSENKKTQQGLQFLESDLSVAYSQTQMNKIFEAVLKPVALTMHDTLKQAQVKRDDISCIVLTGGTTALPVFQKWLRTYFPDAEIFQEDRLGSVGLGLAM